MMADDDLPEIDPGADVDATINGGGWGDSSQQQPAQALPIAGQPFFAQPQQATTVGTPAPSAAPAGQPFFIQGSSESPATKQGSLKDFGDQVWASTLQTGEGLLGFASLATRKLTSNPDAVAWIEQQKRMLADHVTSTIKEMSPAAQNAMASSMFGGEGTPTPGEVGWGHYVGATVASLVPTAVMAVLPGGLVGRAVTKILPKLAGAAATTTTGAAFGAQQAGDAYNALVEQVDKAKPEELMGSPVYAHLRQQGVDDIDARKQLVGQIAPHFAAAQFAVGAAAGAGAGRLLTKGALGAAGASTTKRLAVGAAEGAGTMGFQAGAGNALEQAASTQAGTQQQFDPSQTARALASGALGGALLGGVGGAIHGHPETPLPSDTIHDDQHAALTLALPSPAIEMGGPARPPATIDLPRLPPPGPADAVRAAELARQADEGVVLPPPVQEPTGPRQLPPPATRYGEGFTMPPEGTPAVPLEKQLPAPEQRAALTFNPDRGQGEGFVTAPSASTEPARPSGGMNRGHLVDELVNLGQDARVLRRMRIDQLRDLYDEKSQQPESTRQQFRPTEPASDHPVDQAAAQASEPTAAQAEAGNYEKGHLRVHGLDISIETPKGGVRKGPLDEATGLPAWQATMPAHYGYVRGTVGGDGEQIDVNLGPRVKTMFDKTPAEAAREPVFVVDQVDPKTRKFDEHKAFLGFHTVDEATHAYDDSFSDGSGPQRRGAISMMTFDKFKDWLNSGDTTKALAYKPTVSDELKARRALQKQKMAEPPGVMALVKKNQARPARPEPVIEEEPPEEGEAAAEVAAQPVAFEKEGAPPTTVVKREVPEGQERSPLTTNLDRRLSDLENKVANGLMTAAEADKEYGRKLSGPGRARTYPDFASWLNKRIEHAEDPKVQEALIERARKLQEDKTLTGPRRNAAVRSINKELQRTGKDYADKLRQMLADIEDPVAAAAEREANDLKKNTILDRIKARTAAKKNGVAEMTRGAVTSLFDDPRINRPLHTIIDRMEAAPAHEYFDAIINDPVIHVRLPQVIALARRLKEMLPANFEIMPRWLAAAIYGEPERYIKEGVAGGFDPRHDVIVLNDALMHDVSALEVVLHESMHAVTTRYLREGPARAHAVLDAIRDEINENYPIDLSGEENEALKYALTNNEELHTMLMTSPVVQEIASRITPSAEFRAKLASLGYRPQEGRSLWRSFTGWVRRVLGLSPDGRTDTLLDHVLRPIEDITDRADRFNHGQLRFSDEGLPAELRPAADATADAALSALRRPTRDDLDRVVTRVDPKGMSDRGRRAVLQGATTDGIVNWNRRLFETGEGNPLEDYRTASEAMAARSADLRSKYSDRVAGLLTKLRGPERDKLASLMNDATIANARLASTDPNANAHLTKPDQQRELRSLQARYNALSTTGKQTYNALRDYYRETYDIERQAQLSAMVKTALPNATQAQVAALTQAVKTIRGIHQLVDNPDASPVAQAFADAWQRNRALVRGIAKIHRQGFVQGDYFPLRRFGDYVVNYGTKGTDDYGVEMFEKRSEAERRRAELVKQGVEPSGVLDKRDSHLRDMVPTTVMDELHVAINHAQGFSADQADAVRDLFASIMMQHASRSEAAKSRLRRQGVRGASADVDRVLAQDFLSFTARTGYLDHGIDRVNALAAMRRHAEYLGRTKDDGSQIVASAVIKELEQRMPSGDDASGALTGLTRKFSQMGFIYSLMSPSHMLTSSIEAHMNSSALLGARFGYARAGLALAKALKDTTPVMTSAGAKYTLKALGDGLKAADWNLSNVVRDRLIAGGANRANMIDLFNRLNAAGLIDHSMVREMQRIARPSADLTKGWWGKFMDFNTVGAHAVDVANKTAIAKAAYDLELRKSGSHEAAAKYAVEMARQAMPNYNLANKARISTNKGILGGMAAPLTQFKQYGIHMYSVMANLVHTSLHGADKAERREALKAFAGVLATHAMMAGALTLIADPLRYVMGAYDWISGAAQPHEYQNDVRAWIASAFGPELGEVISRGLPHAAGIDIHRRVGLANLLEVPELKTFDAKGFGEVLAAAMTGAAGEDATQIAGAIQKLVPWSSGFDLEGGVKGLVPRVFRDPMKAMALADRGITDSKGRTVLPASKLNARDVAVQALGFQPADVSEFREGRFAVLQAREEAQIERSRALNAFLTADRTKALQMIQAYNREHPSSPITYSQLLQAQRRQQKQVQTPGSFGLTLPRKNAAEFSRQGAFANAP